MEKRNFLTIALMAVFVISAGFLYSCTGTGRQEEGILLQSQSSDLSMEEDMSREEDMIQEDDVSKEDISKKEVSGEKVNEGPEDEGNRKASGTAVSFSGSGDTEMKDSAETLERIYVHICGAVEKPDVYTVKTGSRLVDIIRLAGGLTKDAAGDYVNQAAVVEDGQRIYIPTREEVKDSNPMENSDGGNSFEKEASSLGSNSEKKTKVNINLADKEELMTLSGIGAARAESIIAYRQEKGGFKTIDEIKEIDGIKDAVFNKICDKITVD